MLFFFAEQLCGMHLLRIFTRPPPKDRCHPLEDFKPLRYEIPMVQPDKFLSLLLENGPMEFGLCYQYYTWGQGLCLYRTLFLPFIRYRTPQHLSFVCIPSTSFVAVIRSVWPPRHPRSSQDDQEGLLDLCLWYLLFQGGSP